MRLAPALCALCLLFLTAASAQFVLPHLGEGGGMPHPAVSTGVDAQAIQSWPSAVGMDAQAAKEMIQQKAPGKTVLLVPAGSIVTMDFRTDRVRIFYDADTDKVTVAPRVG